MKRIPLLFTVFVFFAFLTVPALAAPLEIEVLNNNQEVYIGSEVTYNIELRNNRNVPEDVRVFVRDTHYGWIQNAYTLLKLDQASSKVIDIKFFPTGDEEGLFAFDITIQSFDMSWVEATDTIYLTVKLKFDIEGFYTEIANDNLDIYLILESTEERDIEVVFNLKDISGKTIGILSERLTMQGMETIKKTVPIGDFLAGKYTIEAAVAGTGLSDTLGFEIEPVHDIVEVVKRISTPLYEDVIITIENRGNVIEKDYKTYQTLPNNDLITGMVTEPISCEVEGENKVCGYVVQELTPGSSAMITYRLNYWVIYGQYVVIVLVILAIITFSFIRVTSPTISKRHARKGEDKHSIILEIKNPFMHHLRNVIVRDWISPLARVLHEEFEMLIPVVRRSEAGTELIWKLGDMRPKETRIITYKIKTLVQGSLRMPKAYIRFSSDKGKKTRIFSKHLIVE